LRDLRAWATTIILKRAPTTVLNKQAYLKISLSEFLKNLPAEVEEYLIGRAEEFYFRRFIRDPQATVPLKDCYQFMTEDAAHLPIPAHTVTAAMLARAEDAAATKSQLKRTMIGRKADVPTWQRLKDSTNLFK
jgi:hypothetical protein